MTEVDWPAIALKFAAAIPVTEVSGPAQNRLIQSAVGQRWLIAFSGGADSLALLLWVWGHYENRRSLLDVVHFNHRLRGADSDADAQFAAEVADALGLAFYHGQWADADRPEKVSEAQARAARLAYFARIGRQTGATYWLTGHQADDVAESFLFRAGRGGQLAALAGPRPVSIFGDGVLRIRPLLEVSGRRLRHLLRDSGAVWREDVSNQESCYTRNRLRHRVLPVWQEAMADHDVLNGALRLRDQVEEWADWLAEQAGPYLERINQSDQLDVCWLRGLPKPLGRHLLDEWLLQRCGNIEVRSPVRRQIWTAVWKDSSPDLFWSVGAHVRLELTNDRLTFVHEPEPIPSPHNWHKGGLLLPGTTVYGPAGDCLSCAFLPLEAARVHQLKRREIDVRREVWLFITEATLTLRVRAWEEGDSYTPIGLHGSKKLQDCFTDRRIPRIERNQLPVVVTQDGRIVWVPGLPPSSDWLIPDNTPKEALRLTYRPI